MGICIDEPGGTYWTSWLDFVREQLLDNGLISPEDLSLLRVTDDVEEAVDEIMGFYSVYNSMRYVRGRLVLRLHLDEKEFRFLVENPCGVRCEIAEL